MSDILINFIRAEVFKENGEKKYDRDLWIGVAGKARDKVTTMNGFKEYADRFDFERFDFRMAIELYSKTGVVFKTGECNSSTVVSWLYEMYDNRIVVITYVEYAIRIGTLQLNLLL